MCPKVEEVVGPELLNVTGIGVRVAEVEIGEPRIVDILVCTTQRILGSIKSIEGFPEQAAAPRHIDSLASDHHVFSKASLKTPSYFVAIT